LEAKLEPKPELKQAPKQEPKSPEPKSPEPPEAPPPAKGKKGEGAPTGEVVRLDRFRKK
jgi:hypothetical protein